MPLIGKAWKANVNVWKRHLTLQSVFNHGECIMHVDKNAGSHVVDQNLDRISKEIAYIPLSGRIRSKCSSCMQPFFVFDFFFFFFCKKNEYKTCLPMVTRKWGFQSWSWILDVLLRGPRIWILDVLPRGLRIGILDVLPRGPLKLNFGHAFQRSKYLKFGCASQRPDGFVEGDICANVYWSFTLVPAK